MGQNKSHTLAYSLIALQEMNLAYRFPVIYWNAACLIVDSGGTEDGTDYTKMAQSIGSTRQAGINVSLVDINNSKVGFTVDEANNRVLFGLKGLANINDDFAQEVIDHRPYVSLIDFYNRVHPKKQAMMSLIKGGAFDQFCSRMEAMIQYIWITCDKKKRLTLQNLPGLMRYDMVPNDPKFDLPKRVFEFNRFLKAECNNPLDPDSFLLNSRAIDFLAEIESDSLISSSRTLDRKSWDKVYQEYMDVFREWIAKDKEKLLDTLNTTIFMEDWRKDAKGNISSWEMDALCFYYHDHELKNVNNRKYGFVNFFDLPEEPIVDKVFPRGGAMIPIYKLFKICGTCIAKDKAKSTVYLLTVDGVVPLRFRKEYFSMFDRQISRKNPDGTKSIVEKSWFNKGNMIIVQGIRRGNEFVTKNYKSSNSHQLYHIDEVLENGELLIRSERLQGDMEDEEE